MSVAKTSDIEEDSNIEKLEPPKREDISKGFLYACLGSLTLVMFLVALDVLVVSTIIDQVAKEFGDYSKTGWLVTGYSLPNSLLSLIWGRIGNVFGFRASLVSSIIIFEVGSLVSALSHSMNTLIGGRVIAGIGGSGIQTLSIVIGCTMVSERSRAMVVSVMMSAFAIASIVGPIIGGAFTTHVTWRWCFWINIPIGGLAILVFLLTYPSDLNILQEVRRSFLKIFNIVHSARVSNINESLALVKKIWFKFDIGGLIISCLGLVLILLGLSFGGNEYSWGSGLVISFLIIGILLTILAVFYEFVIFDMISPDPEKRIYRPLLSWELISKRGIYTANLATFLLLVAYNGQMIYSVQFFQLIFGSTAWKAGLHLIPIVVSSVVAAIASGGITKKTGHVKFILLFGTSMGVIGSGLITLLDNNSNSSTQIGVLILPGVALGCSLQAALMGTQLELDPASSSFQSQFVEVTAFNGYMKSLGATFGGILSTMVFGTSVHNMIIRDGLTGYTEMHIDEIISSRMENYDGSHSLIANILNSSVRNVFWMDLGFASLAFIFGVFTTNKKIPSAVELHRDAEAEVLSEVNSTK